MLEVRTVLLVDAMPRLRDALARGLGEIGVTVWIAESVASANRIVREQRSRARWWRR